MSRYDLLIAPVVVLCLLEILDLLSDFCVLVGLSTITV